MLEVSNLNAYYSNLQILWDVSFTVGDGEIVTLLGANGAGKTTLVQSVLGFIPKIEGKVIFQGKDVTGMHPYQVVKEGLSLVPEKRELFPKMTVAENLELGGYSRSGEARELEEIFELFPILQERETQLAGTLSGGEQQMLAIARALMAQPSMLILDEPSLGLSPLLVGNVLDTVTRLNKDGLAILLVEQNVEHALKISNRAYILENGRIIREGDAQELLHDEDVKSAYLGF